MQLLRQLTETMQEGNGLTGHGSEGGNKQTGSWMSWTSDACKSFKQRWPRREQKFDSVEVERSVEIQKQLTLGAHTAIVGKLCSFPQSCIHTMRCVL